MSPSTDSQARTDDALAIWRAGVAAVDSERLVRQAFHASPDHLDIAGQQIPLSASSRLIVIGGGKAGAGMVAGVESALGLQWDVRLSGWVNVPADCVRPTRRITLHAARPAGRNEPTAEGIDGTERILKLAASVGPQDVCLVLLSGGGSALLPAPIAGITLADKLAVTRFLSSQGASIEELNGVRACLSRFKGGGLARTFTAGTCLSLIISDVIGDPLDVIASGPTVASRPNPQFALDVLHRYAKSSDDIPASVLAVLHEQLATPESAPVIAVQNHVIGNNLTALTAARTEAERRGYAIADVETNRRGFAADEGRRLAERCRTLRQTATASRGWCLLSGGEPVVELTPTDLPRRGGRNQELALAALQALWHDNVDGITLVSGGTDGEDGPTDAAGAWIDTAIFQQARDTGLDPEPYLAINNAYPFFEATGGLLKTGPTHTNVMDVRVVLIDVAHRE